MIVRPIQYCYSIVLCIVIGEMVKMFNQYHKIIKPAKLPFPTTIPYYSTYFHACIASDRIEEPLGHVEGGIS